MKSLMLVMFLFTPSFAAEPDYPWPTLNQSVVNLKITPTSSNSSVESVIITDEYVANMFEIDQCDQEFIQNADHIKASISSLCDILDLEKETEAELAALTSDQDFIGYSLAQFCTTGLISAYFDIRRNKVHWNVFSAKEYDIKKAQDFMVFCFKPIKK